MISTCLKAMAVAVVLAAILYHTPGAIEHAVSAAESRSPHMTPPPLGYVLADEYSRFDFYPPEEQ